MKNIIIFSILVIFIVLLGYFGATEYKKNTCVDRDTREFQKIAIDMYKFLKKVERIKPESIPQRNGAVIIVTKRITKYVFRHKVEFDNLKGRLEKFISQHPTSEWHDDAMLFLGLSYFVVNLNEAPFTKDASMLYFNIINSPIKFNIHPLTKDLLTSLKVGFVFKPIPGEKWTEEIEEGERIKVYFSRAIISEYLKKGDFDEAELLVDSFRDKNDIVALSKNIEGLKEYIALWEKTIKEKK